MLENKTLVELANKYSRTPAQVLLRFITQKGLSVVPKSTNPTRMAQNIQVGIYKNTLYIYSLKSKLLLTISHFI